MIYYFENDLDDTDLLDTNYLDEDDFLFGLEDLD
jgi:hypothetical protein